MKILVPVKRVVDYNVKVRPLSDNSNVDLNNVKMSVNPFCEIAVEEAVRLKESGQATEVVVVTVGGDESQEQLRETNSYAKPCSSTHVVTLSCNGRRDYIIDSGASSI